MGSWPEQFTTLGDVTYFFAPSVIGDPKLTSTSLWKTDGTAAGTAVVKTGLFADGRYGEGPQGLTAAGGRLFFSEFDNVGVKLWTSDGTAEGTRELQDVRPVGGGPPFGSFVDFNGKVFFAASDDSVRGLWTTDGTTDGTQPFPVQPQFVNIGKELVGSGNFLYFGASDGSGDALWRTDGSAAGTIRLHDLPRSAASQVGTSLIDVDGTLFFTAATGPDQGVELWKSDGTPEGTTLVKDIMPGFQSSNPSELVNFGGQLFFRAAGSQLDNGQADYGLWKSDGTEAGTVPVKEKVRFSQVGLDPVNLTVLGDTLLFIGSDSATGSELWKSDGTPDGTVLVKETRPGISSRLATNFYLAANQVFFGADDGKHGLELWRTDGTSNGTYMVVDLNPGADGGFDAMLQNFRTEPAPGILGDRIIFKGSDTPGDVEPWISDGTPNNAVRLANINTTPFDSTFTWSMALGDTALIGANGRIYRSDGTPQGTDFLSDRVGSLYQNPYAGRTVVRGVAIFPGADLLHSSEPRFFRSDGTAAGTYRLVDAVEPSYLSIVTANGYAFFIGSDAAHGTGLWRTDGTRAGTVLLKDISPDGDDGINFYEGALVAVGDTIYFKSSYGELWKSNGTPEGTTLVRDLGVSRRQGNLFRDFTGVGDKLFFEAPAGGEYPSLWVSDGTDAGTRPLPAIVASGSIVGFDGAAYFAGAESFGSPTKLYRSDGTAAGTLPIKDFTPDDFTVFSDTLFFIAENGLWKTDGTSDGTVNLAAFSIDGLPRSLTAGPDALYFTADDGVSGRELWHSDGTVDGTKLVQDLYPGATGSDPAYLTAAGDKLFFAAKDPSHGLELWKVSVPRVTDVTISSSAWTDAFLSALHNAGLGDGGYALPGTSPSSPLPWSNVNRIRVRYDADVVAQAQPLKVSGAGGRTYTAALENYNSETHIATWSLPTLTHAERVSITLGASQWSFNLLPGDVDRTGVVNASDLVNVRNRVGRSVAAQGTGATAYSVFSDVNGDGVINAADLVLTRNRIGTSFPVPPVNGMALFSGERIFDRDKSADSPTI